MLPTYLGNYLQQSREQIDGTPTASSQHFNTQSIVLTATQQQKTYNPESKQKMKSKGK
jgi:hypothetical protein